MSNHIADANKMVETPRTDAEECEMFIGVSTFTSGDVQQAFDFARTLERELNAANERIKRLRDGIAKQNQTIEQACGKVLGYPWFKDDQKNFPGSTEKDGVCVGDHVAETIVCELVGKYTEALARIKRLEEAERWIPANTKPEGFERRVLLWIVWPQMHGWCDSPEPLIGWWKHGPKCFALGDIENADHLVRYWMEIPDPTETKEAKP